MQTIELAMNRCRMQICLRFLPGSTVYAEYTARTVAFLDRRLEQRDNCFTRVLLPPYRETELQRKKSFCEGYYYR